MVEHVQISRKAPGAPSEPEPGWWRRLLVGVALLNGVLAITWISTSDGFVDLTGYYAPALAIIALPLVMPSWRSFLVSSLFATTLLLVVGVLLFFFGMYSLWPSAAILLVALTPLARWRPVRVSILLVLLVAILWAAIW